MIQHCHCRIFADEGRFPLFLEADEAHLFVTEILVETIPWRSAAIADHHAGEPFFLLLETLQDRLRGHDLDVILVGCDT